MKDFGNILTYLFVILGTGTGGTVSADDFDALKKEYASARMISLNVKIVVESKIFGDADTTVGEIAIANDGRYFAGLSDDIYLFDGKCTWEYSAENRQATRRCLKKGEYFENRLFFIKDLDRYYKTSTGTLDSVYQLIRIVKEDDALPDTLTVYLSESHLSSVEYFDLNRDLNSIYILGDSILDSVDAGVFELSLPDSVEIIDLP